MTTALVCVFTALIITQNEVARVTSSDDFRPTPIPLKEWRPEKQVMAGTLQESIKTETPPTVAAVPAHYWEDALRHSVYLTLVRDKIDQLIKTGSVISPDGKLNSGVSKEVDDHDLWEKIKSAPFDRLKDDILPPGDVSILAKGKLVEEDTGFRFAEDNVSTKDCGENNCTKAVKAFWSVKRVRQRDTEPSTGKYHYELTFSVTSQTPQKLKKQYENPVRTFTVRENAPTDPPLLFRNFDSYNRQPSRVQRAIWVHKNIAPSQNYRSRQSIHGLDRIFSSLFSDEDGIEEQPHRYTPNTYVPQMHPQYSKIGYVGNRESYHQKKMMPYVAKPQPLTYKFNLPAVPPHSLPIHSQNPFIQHPYLDVDPYANGPFTPYTENKYVSNFIKTTRPAVLPTPLEPTTTLLKESSVNAPVKTTLNATEFSTKPPEAISTYKMYKPKQPAAKITYAPEHVRPPVYNAPPGVFVTMDKKPFKPMPPLKLTHPHKPVKAMPLDFRPSPQILDGQIAETDPAADSAFRPIAMNGDGYHKNEYTDSSKKNIKDIRKPSTVTRLTAKKPPKKQEKIKPQRLTTVVPDIITAHDDDDNDIEWTSLLGAFSKTTPMASQKDKVTTTESTTEVSNTTATPIVTSESESEETDIEYTVTTPATTTTTPIPKKRTRPPPKFKPNKTKKLHKRVTTTTTTTTTKPPGKFTVTKPTEDLTPQASSAPLSGANSVWEEAKTITATIKTTTSTLTKEILTTTRPTTTTRLTSPTTERTTVETEPPVATTQSRNKNRFRQSTLMHKGTSVNHDKWSTVSLDKNRTTPGILDKLYMRRTASKFHGYVSSTTPTSTDWKKNKGDHKNHGLNLDSETTSIESTRDENTASVTKQSAISSLVENEEHNDTLPDSEPEQTENPESIEEDLEENEKENDIRESKDESEYIFETKFTTQENTPIDGERSDSEITIEATTVTSQHLEAKNKTKCKKKKHDNLATEETVKMSNEVFNTTTTSTEQPTTADILEELFDGFTMDDNVKDDPGPSEPTPDTDSDRSESVKQERYIIDDSVDRFLESLEAKANHQADSYEENDKDYDDRIEVEEDSPFDNDDEDEEEESDGRDVHFNDYYDEEHKDNERPYSFLELMAME